MLNQVLVLQFKVEYFHYKMAIHACGFTYIYIQLMLNICITYLHIKVSTSL